MKPLFFTCVAASALLAASAVASVVALNLREMLERADSAVAGTVISKTTWEGPLQNLDFKVEFTTIVVEGEDLYTGKQTKREITYLGSEARPVSEMPVESETRAGARGIYFSVAMPGEWGGRENQNSLIAAQNGVFRLESGPKGDVVIGKGAGAAVESNTFLKDIKIRAVEALAEIRKAKK